MGRWSHLATLNHIWFLLLLPSFVPRVLGQLHPDGPSQYQLLPTLREQARILDEWRQERLNAIPELLHKHGVDAWLMSQREHAEDTIWWSIKSATEFAAHRRTVVLFHSGTNASNASNTSEPENGLGQTTPLSWTWIDNTGAVWPELRAVLARYDPRTIAVNTDRDHAFAGGMHVGEFEVLRDELSKSESESESEAWTSRFVNVPMLAIEYVSRRVPGQIEYYRKMQETAWALMEEAFSERVVVPGVTTTEDLQWWFRDKIQALNYTTWNQPRVKTLDPSSFPGWAGSDSVIEEGDVLHVDFGVSALGMHTDTQHLGYVLRTSLGERSVPPGLLEGLRVANRMQDIVLEEMRPGRTGNEVLRSCNKRMRQEGIEGQVYSHPIGDFGHAPGSTIGFTNLPDHVPVFGELPILPDTYYSIELFARHFVPERNESLRFMLEDNVHWVEQRGRWEFVRGRQERFHIVDTKRRSESDNASFQIQAQ